MQANGSDYININAIPRGEDLELDANGWPKYLGVPAECAAPSPEIAKYFHEMRIGELPAGPGRAHPHGTIIQPNPFLSQNTRIVGITDHTEYALPFFTGVSTGAAQRIIDSEVSQDDRTVRTLLELAISHCPGDFGTTSSPEYCHQTSRDRPNGTPNKTYDECFKEDAGFITPEGREVLNNRCVVADTRWVLTNGNAQIVAEGENANHSSDSQWHHPCVLRPHQKYFLNMRPLYKRVAEAGHQEFFTTNKSDDDLAIGDWRLDTINKYVEKLEQQNTSFVNDRIVGFKQNGDFLKVRGNKRVNGYALANFGVTVFHPALGQRVPYAGPCIDDQEHYPFNYYSGQCGRTRTYEMQLLSLGQRQQCVEQDQVFNCHDTTDVGEPKRFVLWSSCSADGSTMTREWIEGYGESLTPTYVCDGISPQR